MVRRDRFNTMNALITQNPRNPRRDKKIRLLRKVVEDDKVTLMELRELACSEGGFVKAEFRKKLWPKLVGLTDLEEAKFLVLFQEGIDTFSHTDVAENKLIQADVGRSVIFRHNPPPPLSASCTSSIAGVADELGQSIAGVVDELGQSIAWSIKETLGSVLEATVSTPLSVRHGKPHYYQGLHDIAGVLLHNLNGDRILTTAILRRICQSHLQDALGESFGNLLWCLDTVFLPLLRNHDMQVYELLSDSEVSVPAVILPWLITWFTHKAHDATVSSRLVDAFLAQHPLFPMYFAVAMLTYPSFKAEIMEAGLDIDFIALQMTIQSLPSKLNSDWNAEKGVVTVQQLIHLARSIMEETPPAALLQLVRTNGRRAKAALHRRAQSVGVLNVPPSWDVLGTTDIRCQYRLAKENEEEKQEERSVARSRRLILRNVGWITVELAVVAVCTFYFFLGVVLV